MVPAVIATAGVKLSENGQFENAAIAGLGRAAPRPSDREEDDFSIGCRRRYLEESGTFIPAVYEHFRNGADSNRGLAVAAIALLELSAVELAAAFMATVRAQKPIGPSPLVQGVEALVFGSVEREECVEADSFLELHWVARHGNFLFYQVITWRYSIPNAAHQVRYALLTAGTTGTRGSRSLPGTRSPPRRETTGIRRARPAAPADRSAPVRRPRRGCGSGTC